MRVLIYGASGMVGQGVLLECLLDPEVEAVVSVGRSSSGVTHAKLREVIHADLFDQSAIDAELSGHDVCFFCLGISSAGMSEDAYKKVTYDLTLATAQRLLKLNPSITFCYVSGMGTDSSEKGRTMWARVKGQTENALLGLGFKKAFMFRPGFIQPLKGVKSKTPVYRVLYTLTMPFAPVLGAIFPKAVTTTQAVGRAMIRVAQYGYEKPVLETPDINSLSG